jgi:hypothetical protein
MEINASNFSVEAIRAVIAEKERETAEEKRKYEAEAATERKKLHEEFMERQVPADALNRIALMVRAAVERGEKQVLVFQFPSDWMPDQGRSLTTHAENWHEHLDGFARRAYAYFEKELKPRGFQLRAEILNWPGGMPGDVGFFLRWKRPDAL